MISVTWPTGIILVPKADTVFAGTDPATGREIRTYDTDQFWREIADLFDDEVGRVFPRPWDYNKSVTLGGVPYAAQLEVRFEYYQVEFENGSYRVILQGTNNNLADVAVINDVSIQPSNSAGSTVPVTPADIWAALKSANNEPGSFGESVQNTEKSVRSLL